MHSCCNESDFEVKCISNLFLSSECSRHHVVFPVTEVKFTFKIVPEKYARKYELKNVIYRYGYLLYIQ